MSTDTDAKTTYRCDRCGKTLESKRFPRGWKKIAGQLLCKADVSSGYRIGCVAVGVRFSDDEDANKELNALLNRGFSLSTATANWFMTELYSRDVRRTPDMEKLLPKPIASLYGESKQRFPLAICPSGLLAAMENRVRGIYSAHRWHIIWSCRESLPSFRYPHPYPVREQDWSISEEDGNLFVSVNIARERITLPLSISHKYERQRAGLRKIIEGSGKFGELLITRSRDGKVFCRIAGYFPRDNESGKTGTLFVKSCSDSLIVALNAKEQRLWNYHADHVRRWVYEHRRKLQRWADDTKFEDRPRPGFAERRDASVAKYRHRMETVTHQIAARIVNYAKRRRFQKIRLDLSDQTFVDRFPWHELESKIKDKSNQAGIELEIPEKTKD